MRCTKKPNKKPNNLNGHATSLQERVCCKDRRQASPFIQCLMATGGISAFTEASHILIMQKSHLWASVTYKEEGETKDE